MASNRGWRLVSVAVVFASLFGCSGQAGKAGANGVNSLVQLSPEAAGTNCPQGGTRIQSGPDANRNGSLEASEVAATQYVCNGAAGANGHHSLLATAPEAPGANCASGGTRIQSGLDANDNATLDPAEVTATQYVCSGAAGTDGRTSLVATANEPVGTNCPTGGVRVQSGVDANGNATLDVSEVVLTQFVCNGIAGTNGVSSLVTTSAESAGGNCQHGGTRIESGLDSNRNGSLDVAEVTAMQYVCNGAPGANGLTALVSTSAEPAGSSCAAGGTRIESGLDLDADGTLDAVEVTSTRFACNGANGTDGTNGQTSLVTTSPEAAGANCASGGVRIQSGLDASRDGTLDLAEVSSTQYVCNGAAGTNGQSALLALSPEAAGSNCANGGTRVQSGLDANGNATLDADEVSVTQYLCDGADGTNGLTSLVSTAPEAAGANCPNGGTRVQSGLDANDDGTLDVGEVASTHYVCSGAAGASGASSLVVTAPEGAGPNCTHGGIRVQSGLDADASGFLDPAEVTVTQYVCNGATGAPGASSLVTTAPELSGVNCQYGGTRIDSGLDANSNGTLDLGEVTATQYACNGAPGTPGGPGPATVIGLTPEPAGAHCPNGGTRVQSGLDANGNGVLDPAEVSATQYVCDPDSSHPYVVAATPAPGSPNVLPDARFCVTFSEPIARASLDASQLYMYRDPGAPVPASIAYDAATATACLDPMFPLDYFMSYVLVVGGGIRDPAGNPLVPRFTASYFIAPPALPNLRVSIDSVTPGAGTLDIGYTVVNADAGSAGPFTVGFFVDPPWPPGVGAIPTGSVDVAGLPPLATVSGTISLAAAPGAAVFAYADVYGYVAESNEMDNLGGVQPALTGPIVASPGSVPELGQLDVTVPVNAVTRCVTLSLGNWGANPPLGTACGNDAGEGFVSGSFQVPYGMASLGTASVGAALSDAWDTMYVPYAADAMVSPTNLARLDPAIGWVDSGIPLTFVTITPVTSPNLTMTIDAVTPGAGTIDLAYTVRNTGYGDAGAFTVGFFVDPATPPSVGSAPDGTADLAGLPVGSSASGIVTLTGTATSTVLAYADVAGAVAETNESDNLGRLTPMMTGAPVVTPTSVEWMGSITVTVPVNSSARNVEIMLGSDLDMGGGWSLGNVSGNSGGEGVISGTLMVPNWMPLGTWIVVVRVTDETGSGRLYAPVGPVSAVNYAVIDSNGMVLGDSGIPLTTLSVVPPTTPNLTVSIDSVTPGAGTLDVAYTVSNSGYGDAGPFTVGFFVDPAIPPAVGATPDGSADLPGLAVGSSASGIVTLTGTAASNVLAYADVTGAVAETVEWDNLGRLTASITGMPVVTPSSVESTGAFTVTVPVNATARDVEISLGGDWFPGPSWSLGHAWGNYEGQGAISGTFTVPGMVPPGPWTVWVRVRDEGGVTQRDYALVSSVSSVDYSIVDPGSGLVIGDSGIPLASVSVVPPTHPNLVVTIDSVTPGAGTVDVGFTVTNGGFSDAGASTVGFFVDPFVPPMIGAVPDAAYDVPALAVGASVGGSVTLNGGLASSIFAYADLTGLVTETNESDNLASPRPALIGPIVATPATVDDGTALTLTIPVNGTTHNAEVLVGSDYDFSSWRLGYLSGNYDREGFIRGTVMIPPGSAWMGTVSVWVYLRDEAWTKTTGYVVNSTVSPAHYASFDPMTGTGWADSGIVATTITVVPASRPNLTVTIDQLVPGGGTVDVTYTVRNVGAGGAGPSEVGFFADPAAIPVVGSVPDAADPLPPLAVGGSFTSTVTLTASAASAIFAYADAGGAIDEQSETDNAAWVLPTPAMTGPPIASAPTVAVGGTIDVTVPVSSSVRRIDVYVGTASTSSPSFIGTATGNAGGEGTIQASCTLPPMSAGDWFIWVATYDGYGLSGRGYLSFAPVSSTYYTESDMSGPPSTPTTIPLTALTVTP